MTLRLAVDLNQYGTNFKFAPHNETEWSRRISYDISCDMCWDSSVRVPPPYGAFAQGRGKMIYHVVNVLCVTAKI
jgi:hypothetical protein